MFTVNYSYCQSDQKLRVEQFLKEWYSKASTVAVRTSGSTGQPKEITIKKSAMVLSAKRTLNHFEIQEGGTAFLCVSPETIAGKMMIVRAIVGNLVLYVGDTQSTPKLPIEISVDLCAMVPMQLMNILQTNVGQLSQIRINLIGGGPISPVAIEKLSLSGNNAYHTFGMTETISHIAVRSIGKHTESAFTVLTQVDIDVVDGKLVINDQLLESGPIMTNDLVEKIDETHFEWIGRADFVILSGGKKFYAEEIEAKLQRLIVFPFFIAALNDETLGQRVVIYVESNNPLRFTKQAFSNFLPTHQIPKEAIFMDSFVRTESGKIDRGRTQELNLARVTEKIL
jgi:O-succinylbenzoic acid--CoA ligase